MNVVDNNTRCLNIIERIFSNWTALKMAVEHGMGTKEEARDFCDYVAGILAINNEKLDPMEIAEELIDYMDDKFNTTLEDDSEKQVAEEIHRLHNLLLNDVEKFNSEIVKLPDVQPWILKGTDMVCKESDDDDDDNVSSNTSKNKMEVDEDGFALVTRKRR